MMYENYCLSTNHQAQSAGKMKTLISRLRFGSAAPSAADKSAKIVFPQILNFFINIIHNKKSANTSAISRYKTNWEMPKTY